MCWTIFLKASGLNGVDALAIGLVDHKDGLGHCEVVVEPMCVLGVNGKHVKPRESSAVLCIAVCTRTAESCMVHIMMPKLFLCTNPCPQSWALSHASEGFCLMYVLHLHTAATVQ